MAKKKKIAESGPSLFDMRLEATKPAEIEQPAVEQEPISELPVWVEPEIVETHPLQTVKLRDGEILTMGEEVIIDGRVLAGLVKEPHEGKIFVIEKMTIWENCESGMLVIAYQKENPQIRTVGIAGKGIDANWFKKINS